MSKIEMVMLCLAYALNRVPHVSEIQRAKQELSNVAPHSAYKVIRSARFLYQYMTADEILLFEDQVCMCMLSAINYRISLAVKEYSTLGYAICPRCGFVLDRDYQDYCTHCGQHLKWGKRQQRN